MAPDHGQAEGLVMDRAAMVSIVLGAIDEEIASGLDQGEPVVSTEDTRLLGAGPWIDSLGLVSVIVQVEERLAGDYGISVPLVDWKAMSQENSPFRSVGALATYALDCTQSPAEPS
jgi:acyl carrier protein